ncbi:MAG TPA: hypothetical protein VHP38_01160 [Ruminiclostridium sp.]|nr:hypothetical protein [Ruminiclostridium sp.]
MNTLLFERDLLYPTQNIIDPGILHVKLLSPTNSRIPVIIEPKSMHSAVANISTILDVMQKEIFDRINIKLSENTLVYLRLNELDKPNYGDSECLQVVFKEGKDVTYEPAGLENIL